MFGFKLNLEKTKLKSKLKSTKPCDSINVHTEVAVKKKQNNEMGGG